MRFPKAYEGVRLILIAEILSLIVFVLQLGNVAAALLPDTGSLFFIILRGVTLLSTIAAGLLSVADLALLFIGMATAKADEPRFGTALLLTVISCVVAAVLAIAMIFAMVLGADFTVDPPAVPPISGWFTGAVGIISSVLTCCAMRFIASGVVRLAQKLGDRAMAAYSGQFQRVITASFGVSAAVSAVSILVRRGSPGYFYDWTTALSSLASFVSVTIIIRFLSKARNMLAR